MALLENMATDIPKAKPMKITRSNFLRKKFPNLLSIVSGSNNLGKLKLPPKLIIN